MRAVLALSILALVSVAGSTEISGVYDPEFDKVPFDQWFAGGPQAHWKWSAHVQPLTLSAHQRLMADVRIQLDSSVISKQRAEGRIIFFFQITDQQGRKYQDHGEIDLQRIDHKVKSVTTFTDRAFVVPGDYTLSFAAFDTASGEHVAQRETLHVPPFDSGRLPGLWRDLPSVDFVDASEQPDSWYLPKARGRLHLALAPQRPVRLEVVANLTPSYRAKSNELSALLPYVKVLSEISGSGIRKNFTLLDVPRRRVVYEQRDVDTLNWPRMRAAIQKLNSGLIDRTSLAHRGEIGGYFVGEVAQRLAADDASEARIAIVLSSALIFDIKQQRPEAQISSSPNSRVFYLRIPGEPRLIAVPDSEFDGADSNRAGPRQPDRMPATSRTADRMARAQETDELAHLFASPGLRLFDVQSADAFRRALSAIIDEIGSI